MSNWLDLKLAVESICADTHAIMNRDYETISSSSLRNLLQRVDTLEWLAEEIPGNRYARSFAVDSIMNVLRDLAIAIQNTNNPPLWGIVNKIGKTVHPIIFDLKEKLRLEDVD